MKIKDFLLNYHNFKVDLNYQRPPNAWSLQDKQCLIDSILADDPIPMFFINEKGNKKYIVDGQQRLSVIKEFHDSKFKLSSKFSPKEIADKTFADLSTNQQQHFLNYNLTVQIIEGNDEKIRSIFSRLQRGKPLSLGERLNALPGNIVSIMRKIAKHDFISKSLGINQDRYGAFPDAMRLLLFEFYGPRESSSEALYEFMENKKDLKSSDITVKTLKSNLDFLRKCFPEDHYAFLEKHAWVLTVYSLISSLKKTHVLKGKEKKFKEFIENFHMHCYDQDYRKSKTDYQTFYDNIRGGWSEKIINLRLEIIKKYATKHMKLIGKDLKRQITNIEKIQAYAKHPYCMRCNYKFKDYKEPNYHHKNLYSLGGKTNISNIMVICKECHKKIHSHISGEFEEVDV
ncbi:GmrSD restriction endonuclease domain-containing protein [Candidatus Avelusimicrobium fimicolum]|uniref:GmrSD restriction endonuclease domain-containing protein n=1 Tax=Candidatus Avelusimicrobium fimicolum TaxID=3416216 RepID=UPI003D0BDE9B